MVCRWLSTGNRTVSELVNMVITWWIVTFLHSANSRMICTVAWNIMNRMYGIPCHYSGIESALTRTGKLICHGSDNINCQYHFQSCEFSLSLKQTLEIHVNGLSIAEISPTLQIRHGQLFVLIPHFSAMTAWNNKYC